MSCCRHGPNGGCCGETWCQPPDPEWGEAPDWREHVHGSDAWPLHLEAQHGPNTHTHGADGKVNTIMEEPYNPKPEVCRCSTQRHDPDCHIDHTLSALEADIAFPQRGRQSNPNPMNSRCGLEDCDCGYVIEKLQVLLQECLATIRRRNAAITRHDSTGLRHPHLQNCDSSCPCYQAGYEAERQPLGS